jgi:hypothetical protein
MPQHRVRVSALPAWVDHEILLGPGVWRRCAHDEPGLAVEAELERGAAADLTARLRGIGLGGSALAVDVQPPLPRAAVRKARSDEARRYRDGSPGFTRAGARLDPEAKRSLTPEALALQIGQRAQGAHVLDACCGAGGNAIGFARAGSRVTAIELDGARLALAQHNAQLYGVADRIRFVAGDARELLPTFAADLLFVDPPWGERYDKQRVALADLPLLADLVAQRTRYASTWLKVPPSFDPTAIDGARPSAWFGVAEGDARRVKFLLLECGAASEPRA